MKLCCTQLFLAFCFFLSVRSSYSIVPGIRTCVIPNSALSAVPYRPSHSEGLRPHCLRWTTKGSHQLQTCCSSDAGCFATPFSSEGWHNVNRFLARWNCVLVRHCRLIYMKSRSLRKIFARKRSSVKFTRYANSVVQIHSHWLKVQGETKHLITCWSYISNFWWNCHVNSRRPWCMDSAVVLSEVWVRLTNCCVNAGAWCLNRRLLFALTVKKHWYKIWILVRGEKDSRWKKRTCPTVRQAERGGTVQITKTKRIETKIQAIWESGKRQEDMPGKRDN
jgi:hypothetical protein